MTLGIDRTLPRFLIDDTADISNARVFIAHTQEPRFVGELLPDDEAAASGVTFAAPCNQTVCHITWTDDAIGHDLDELAAALADAITRHDKIKNIVDTNTAAKQIGVSHRRIVAMITAGQLPAEKVGGQWIIKQSDLDKFAATPRPTGRPPNK